MYESRHKKPISRRQFALRVLHSAGLAFPLVLLSLAGGMAGYMLFEKLSWEDAFLNASMLLGGMGPVATLKTEAGKIFAGIYALYAGLIFLIAAGLVLAPFFHRVLHRFHWEQDQKTS
ncbi:MAG TPA: hypothetical protein VFT93_05675 [Candidatus Eisenbacteria bacterium]|jgi:hypothetical protein|nr:hypothetical protein [Candidatus Eisenbacteria bacterium]